MHCKHRSADCLHCRVLHCIVGALQQPCFLGMIARNLDSIGDLLFDCWVSCSRQEGILLLNE
jgi:hypothetical protein